jgi:hypothetical protein
MYRIAEYIEGPGPMPTAVRCRITSESRCGSVVTSSDAWLCGQLDHDGCALDRQEHIAEVFSRTVQLDEAFLDDAYTET